MIHRSREQEKGKKEKNAAQKVDCEALNKCDILSILSNGFDELMTFLFAKDSIPFQEFLECTGNKFDEFILETCKTEKLKYAGGKMIFLKNSFSEDISITADFYFQSFDQKWFKKNKEAHVKSEYFSDWDTNEDVAELCRNGKLELFIESPE